MRVVVAEDSLLTREGIVRVLERAGADVVAEAGDARALLAAVAQRLPDVAVIDVRMPPTHSTEGIEAARRILDEHPQISVLVLSQHIEPVYALTLLEERPHGVGYLLKERVSEGAVLLDCLERLTAGESVLDPAIVQSLLARPRRDPLGPLTDREREVLALVAEGLSNRAIAERLWLAERTVEAHMARILPKLGILDGEGLHRRVVAALAYVDGTRTRDA